MKKLFTILAVLVMLVGGVYAAVNTTKLPAPESGNTGVFLPGSDDSTDIGSSSLEFKDLYIDGVAYIDDLEVTGNITVTGVVLESVTTLQLAELAGNTATLTVAQSGYIVIDASTSVTIVLPAVSGNSGLSYTVINSSTSVPGSSTITVTLDGNSSETINGSTTNNDMDATYDTMKVTCDGSEWFITGGNVQ